MAADDAVLAVDRDTGEIAYMLVGAGELVEERGLAAVLVAYQREGERGPLRKGIARALGVKLALLAETGVRGGLAFGAVLPVDGCRLNGLNADLLRVGNTQCQLIAVQAQLHRVAHRGQLDHRHLDAGDQTHVQKMLAQCAFSADRDDAGTLSGL